MDVTTTGFVGLVTEDANKHEAKMKIFSFDMFRYHSIPFGFALFYSVLID